MLQTFVLIDALPKREQDVYEALGRLPFVVSRRLLPHRAGQGDILALVETADKMELERRLTNDLRGVPHVHNIIRLRTDATLLGPLSKAMEEMYHEAQRRKGP